MLYFITHFQKKIVKWPFCLTYHYSQTIWCRAIIKRGGQCGLHFPQIR